MSGIPTVGDGFRAEVRVGGQYLCLFSEVYELGHRAVVYDINAKHEVSRQGANDLEDGKKKAEGMAAEYLKRKAGDKLPAVDWKLKASRAKT